MQIDNVIYKCASYEVVRLRSVPIGVNLGSFDSVLATIDINMPPLQGLDLCSDTLL